MTSTKEPQPSSRSCCEEDRTLRAVLVGMLRDMERRYAPRLLFRSGDVTGDDLFNLLPRDFLLRKLFAPLRGPSKLLQQPHSLRREVQRDACDTAVPPGPLFEVMFT